MKDKKKRLWWADRLKITLAVLLVLAAMIAKAGSAAAGFILMLLVLPVFLGVEFTMNRCPHCGRHLDRNRGQFCQHCGERIREEKADT